MARIDHMSTTKTSPKIVNLISKNSGWLLFSAWVVALVATLGALFIGEVLGQEPCVLCWYQRIAMFPLALMLGIASLNNDTTIRRYALPQSMIGIAIAMWHTLLYVGVISEAIIPCSAEGPSCTDSGMTILGGVPLPAISLVSFVAISIFLFLVPGTTKHE